MVDGRIHVARADLLGIEERGIEYVDLERSLADAAGAATAITILGGYFKPDRLIELCKNVPKPRRADCKVRFAVGLDAIALLPRIWKDLRRVSEKLTKLGFRNVTLAVVRSTPVHFHTKLFYFLKSTRPVWFVGSANPGSDRHELMVNFSGRHEALSQYIEAVFAAATVVDAGKPPKMDVVTLRDFFLSGKLVHKPPAPKTFTFDAFRFNSDDKEQLIRALSGNSGVAHARPTASGFVFSLRSAMGMGDSASDEAGVVDEIQRTSSRTYSADTVFGHWVPAKYARGIERQIHEATHQRYERLTAFATALDAPGGLEKATEQFRVHVADMKQFLKDNDIGAMPVPDQDAAFKRFLSSRHRMLVDPFARERQARSITIADMPDIWNDDRATNAFERSFFEDIAYRASLTGSGRGRIVKSLEEAMDTELPDSAEELSEALKAYLAENAWLETGWTD